MQRFRSILLDVWREACQHIEIGESVARIAPLLIEHLPFDALLVRRIDLQRSALETVAAGTRAGGSAPSLTRSDLRTEEMQRLLAWCREGQVQRGSGGRGQAISLLPEGLAGSFLAGPLLKDGEDPVGVLVIVAHRSFAEEHQPMFEALLEPFVTALENDRRLREMTTLHEAAEAEKRSLLARLGREDVPETIVGADGGLRAVMERVHLVARSDVPVLIFGETGSGKEVVARAIHTGSRRSSGPFLRVNCGAIPPELIDSELFGHERGSFTGAASLRKGWFERADGGTLFLDEIGELSLAAQVRLLRILQDGTFERVGGQRPMHVDVRIVAATHRDLQAMVAGRQFREDLWYRVAVFPIHLPALREHPEDIPALATHFALRAARRFGLAPLTPRPDEFRLLLSYPWPGNVRELGTVIERAAILGEGRALEVAKALGPVPSAPGSSPIRTTTQTPRRDEELLTLDAAMARHIELALERTGGRIEGARGAAVLLGINPHTLRARMRKLGVDWQRFRADAG